MGTRDRATTSHIMSTIRSGGTKAELALAKAMWSLGLRYRKRYPLVGRPDFVFVRARIVVFCDGDFWHGRGFGTEERARRFKFESNREYWTAKINRNIERDKVVNTQLETQGWLVLRFWESEILQDADALAKVVLAKVRERRQGPLQRTAIEK